MEMPVKTKPSRFAHHSFYGVLICALGALFYCYEYLLRITPSVMVPELMHAFKVNAEGLGWLVAMYYYAYTPMQSVVGISTDYFGPRRVLAAAIALCAGGSFMFGLGHDVITAGIGRLLIGAGSAFAFVCALKLAATWLAPERFAVFVGITTALGMLGAMVGDVAMSRVVGGMGWDHVLLISAIVGIILLPIFWFLIPDHNPAHDDGDRQTIKQLLRGLWKIIGSLQVWLCGLIGCMLFLSLSAFAEIWGIPFMHSYAHISHTQAADLNSMVFLGWLVGSPLSGWLSNRFKSRRSPLIIGSLLAALIFSCVLYLEITSFWILGSLLFLFGLFASAENLAFVIVRENTPVSMAATALGFTNLLIMLGGMVFQPLVGILLDSHWTGTMENGLRQYTSLDYHYSLSVIPAAMILAAILGLFIKESYSFGKD
jgi:MFS family permease